MGLSVYTITKCSNIHLYSTHTFYSGWHRNTLWSSSRFDRSSLVFMCFSLLIHCKALCLKCYNLPVLVCVCLQLCVAPSTAKYEITKKKTSLLILLKKHNLLAKPQYLTDCPAPLRWDWNFLVQVESDLCWKSIFSSCFWLRSAVWVKEMCCIMRE